MRGQDDAARDLEAKWRAAVAAKPNSAEAYVGLGRALQSQNQIEAALVCYAAARARAPRSVAASVAAGDALLLLGRYDEAWPLFERRSRAAAPAGASPPPPVWTGEPLAGRSILIDGLHDACDAIQFLRYIPLLAEQGRNVVLATPRELVRTAASLPVDNLQIVRDDAEAPAADRRCPIVALPRIFKTRADHIPGRAPYLAPRRAVVERWARAIAGDGRLKVGLSWDDRDIAIGSANMAAPADIAALFGIRTIAWFNLQTEAAPPAVQRHGAVSDLSDRLTDLAETAAAILNLDLVICSDGLTAHLAGALGRPAWVMLPFAADWRWLCERADSPWYPSLRLFRQPAPGEWKPVVVEIAQAVGRLAERQARRGGKP